MSLLVAAALLALFVVMVVITGRQRARLRRASARLDVQRRHDERAAANALRVGSDNVTVLGNGRPPVEETTP